MLFVAAGSEVSAADRAKVRDITSGLARGIARAALRAVPVPRPRPADWRLDALVDEVVDRVMSRPGLEADLLEAVRRIRQSNASAPPRDPGELSLPREGARTFATWAYGAVLDAVGESLPKPAWLATAAVLKKTWISQGDSRVRPLHRRLHGRTVTFGRPFWRWPVTGQELRFPGDPDAPLDAVLGCRCVCWLSWSKPKDLREAIENVQLPSPNLR